MLIEDLYREPTPQLEPAAPRFRLGGRLYPAGPPIRDRDGRITEVRCTRLHDDGTFDGRSNQGYLDVPAGTEIEVVAL